MFAGLRYLLFPFARVGMNVALQYIGYALNVQNKGRGEGFMKKQQGFSLIELLIVVAIIAIIAAIAVPSMLQARMAANESGAIQGCRTVGSAEVAFAAINNQSYTDLSGLVGGGFLDSRFDPTGAGFNGYTYDDQTAVTSGVGGGAAPDGFQITANPVSGKGRYLYGIAPDQIVRYQGALSGLGDAKCGAQDCAPGDPIGTTKGSSS
jgi:prepilin-type N-terminal cleavage/methylation domain-containing protein